MDSWQDEELNKLGAAQEVEIAPRREDGTLHRPVVIWAVRVEDDMYVRSYRGENGSWYRAACKSREGVIAGGGVEKEVRFVEPDSRLQSQIDAAYQSKYKQYPTYVRPMLTAEAQAATLKLVPSLK